MDAEDAAGNGASDDNGGICYTFTTPEIPDFFTELFTSDNDTDFLRLAFTPNGSPDFYEGCAVTIAAFPTDPTGGTVLSLTDDSFATVTLTGGNTVSLYGVPYSTFYVEQQRLYHLQFGSQRLHREPGGAFRPAQDLGAVRRPQPGFRRYGQLEGACRPGGGDL